jgi:hypothetical protein
VSDCLFLGDTSEAQAKNNQEVLYLEEGYLFVGRSWKKNQVWGLTCLYRNHIQRNWTIAQHICNPEHISFWNNTIKSRLNFPNEQE